MNPLLALLHEASHPMMNIEASCIMMKRNLDKGILTEQELNKRVDHMTDQIKRLREMMDEFYKNNK